MIINTNMPALNAHNNINRVALNRERASKRLSSGLKINAAADDAAGLAISEKMKAQIRGLDQASRNIQDGLSLLDVEDGGMDQISSMIIRSRELIIQALNDTNTEEDRNKIQSEIDQLMGEINACANNTQFNTLPLLNVPAYSWTVVPGTPQPLVVYTSYESMNPLEDDSSILRNATFTDNDGLSMQTFYYHIKDSSSASVIEFNIERYMLEVANSEGIDLNSFINDELYGVDDSVDPSNATKLAKLIAKAMEEGFNDNTNESFTISGKYGNGRISFKIDNPADTGLNMGGCSSIPSNGFGHNYMHCLFAPDPASKYETQITYSPTDLVYLPTSMLWIQSGANSDDGVFINRYDCRTEALGIEDIVVKPRDEANRSLGDLDDALDILNTYRATCGAQHNRLEFSNTSVNVTSNNLSDALSRISDADMAKEMMNFTKANVLQQASSAMLAQANQSPEDVLQLLR